MLKQAPITSLSMFDYSVLSYFVVLMLLSTNILAKGPVINLCYENQNYSPYLTGHGEVPQSEPGILLDIINEASKKSGVTVNYYRRPWKRCIADVGKGKADGLFAAIWLPERDAWGAYPKDKANPEGEPNTELRLWTAEYIIYHHIKSKISWDGSTFSNIKHGIGAPLGYVAEKKLKAIGVHSPLPTTPSHAFKLLSKNRLDGYVIERNIGRGIINNLGLKEPIVAQPKSYFEANWYVVLSHQFYSKHEKAAEKFWFSLKDSREKIGANLEKHYSKTTLKRSQ